MPKKRIKKISRTLRQLGEIRVNSWEFPEIFSRDIKDLEIRQSLQRLGRIRVTDWDFKDVLPVVNRVAQTEIDIDGFVRRAAGFKVIEWDFREALDSKQRTKIGEVSNKLTQYLEYVIPQLIDEPKYLSIHVEEIAPRLLRFRAVMTKRDSSMLIGMNGKTAEPIRHLLKDSAELHGAKALLEIKSHGEAGTLHE